MSVAITFENISKLYRLGVVSTGTLHHDLKRWWATSVLRKEDPFMKVGETNDRSTAGKSDYVWALKDINLSIDQGDVVGIIGRNGAGKSTLLKILSRITSPTTGTIRANGRIGALLEVGTGFHPEMTGRENIFLNGAILGMSKHEISRKLDAIVDFSGCERYIDTPVKRYSSGMMVRLGFAVAAHLEPEILVVDEVLAVGDAEFQKKAIGKMQDVSRSEGRTVLFVSHNMAAIKSLCRKGVVLKNGQIDYMGTAAACVEHYMDYSNDIEYSSQTTITKAHHDPGTLHELEYLEVRMLNDVRAVSTEEPLLIEATIRRNKPSIQQCQFGVIAKNHTGAFAFASYSQPMQLPKEGSLFKVVIEVPHHNLAKGLYSFNLNMSIQDFASTIHDYDIVSDVLGFEISYVDKEHKRPFTTWTLSTSCSPIDSF